MKLISQDEYYFDLKSSRLAPMKCYSHTLQLYYTYPSKDKDTVPIAWMKLYIQRWLNRNIRNITIAASEECIYGSVNDMDLSIYLMMRLLLFLLFSLLDWRSFDMCGLSCGGDRQSISFRSSISVIIVSIFTYFGNNVYLNFSLLTYIFCGPFLFVCLFSSRISFLI